MGDICLVSTLQICVRSLTPSLGPVPGGVPPVGGSLIAFAGHKHRAQTDRLRRRDLDHEHAARLLGRVAALASESRRVVFVADHQLGGRALETFLRGRCPTEPTPAGIQPEVILSDCTRWSTP